MGAHHPTTELTPALREEDRWTSCASSPRPRREADERLFKKGDGMATDATCNAASLFGYLLLDFQGIRCSTKREAGPINTKEPAQGGALCQ